MTLLIIKILIVLTISALAVYLLRGRIVKWLRVLQYRMKIRGLRTAIQNADNDKAATGRKNMVVFNSASGEFEEVTKQYLKFAASRGKRKNNAAQTPGRKRAARKQKSTGRKIDYTTIKTVEKKSPYVTS